MISMLKNSCFIILTCTTAAQQHDRSCLQQLQKDMSKEQQNMLAALDSQRVLAMMTEFYEKKERQSPLFKFVRTYMRMVLLIYNIHVHPCYPWRSMRAAPLVSGCPVQVLLRSRQTEVCQTGSSLLCRDDSSAGHRSRLKSSWVKTSQLTKIGSHSVPSAWIMLLSTSTASWKSPEDLWALHRMPVLGIDSSLQVLNWVGSRKKHGSPTAIRKEHHELSLAVWTRQKTTLLDWKVFH